MRRRAAHLLHVLACAPAAVLLTAATTPSLHAHAATASTPRAARAQAPPQQVVVLDAGHGGSPDNAHPDVPFDPGAVAANGLLEKDVALDLVRRLRALLEKDGVNVVLTRDSDVWMSIEDRSNIANAAHADVFVSCHLNGWTDPSAEGSVVLYPSADDLTFAQVISDALNHHLAQYQVADGGVILRDNWWIHTTMPTVTVESAYLTSPHDADLLTHDDVRDVIAAAMRDGIEVEDPLIGRRQAALAAGATDPTPRRAPAPAPGRAPATNPIAPSAGGGASLPRVALPLGVLLVLLAAVFRRRLGRLLVDRLPHLEAAFDDAVELMRGGSTRRHTPVRARRARAARRQAVLARTRRGAARRGSAYDELWS